jgi:hypothetical protein
MLRLVPNLTVRSCCWEVQPREFAVIFYGGCVIRPRRISLDLEVAEVG